MGYRSKKSRSNSNIPNFATNKNIRAESLLVIDQDGNNLGELTRVDALILAKKAELDLVLVNPQGKPPVAKITDWKKMLYDLKKKAKSNSSTSSQLSEIRVSQAIEEGDLQHKLANVKRLLDGGNKVKFTIRSRRGYPKEGKTELMKKVLGIVSDYAKPEGPVKSEGWNIAVYLIAK